MIISIDHGNKQIKTLNRTFTSGLYESESKPAFGEDVLYYNGKYYVLSEERIPYMRDKTKDNRFFILTLFAIAYEIEASGKYPDNGTLDIKLNVGLPPSHYSGLYEKYEDYFRGPRRPISFTFREKPYSIFISEKMKLCAEARQWSGYAPLICSRASADGGVKGGEAVHLDP